MSLPTGASMPAKDKTPFIIPTASPFTFTTNSSVPVEDGGVPVNMTVSSEARSSQGVNSQNGESSTAVHTPTINRISATNQFDKELSRYMKHLQPDSRINSSVSNNSNSAECAGLLEEIKTTPLFTWDVKLFAASGRATPTSLFSNPLRAVTLEQYAVIGSELPSETRRNAKTNVPIFLNTNAPWSAFICGSQGSGKSYTLSCMLENCLLPSEDIGSTPNPLAGVLFHYDPRDMEVACEAAYLATHIPVRVLVSPSNYYRMEKLYKSIPGLENKIKVQPLMLQEKHLNTQRMLRLMAFSEKDGAVPLYMEVILTIMRDMAVQAKGVAGLNYRQFVDRVRDELSMGSNSQKGPLNMRLALLDSFMDVGSLAKWLPKFKKDAFTTVPGELTIVDLTDPFVDPGSACVMFDVALALFLESNKSVGKVVALDEAHKFMTDTDASSTFTDSILTLIREQRHAATRIIIATQEPTISPKLLDLCSMTFVHRFTSPAWFTNLKAHLAVGESRAAAQNLFEQIVKLNVGEAVLFAPAAMLDVGERGVKKVGWAPVSFRTRMRVTKDGGKSVMASAGDGEE